MRKNYNYEGKVGKNIFLVFLLLVYIALNIATEGRLLSETLEAAYNIASKIVPLVEYSSFVNPFAL